MATQEGSGRKSARTDSSVRSQEQAFDEGAFESSQVWVVSQTVASQWTSANVISSEGYGRGTIRVVVKDRQTEKSHYRMICKGKRKLDL